MLLPEPLSFFACQRLESLFFCLMFVCIQLVHFANQKLLRGYNENHLADISKAPDYT